MAGALTLSADPVTAQQASTKHYVDEAMTSLLPLSGGWLQGPLTLSGDPSSDSQAATKHYVDQSAQGTLQKAGGTMTGALTLSADPVTAQQASTKHYVDQAVTSLLPITGGWLQGPLTLSGDPSSDSQAATKHYVDESAQGTLQKVGGTMSGALIVPMVNGKAMPTGSATLQNAIDAAAALSPKGSVEIPATYTGTDTFTNTNGVRVEDKRLWASQNERSVKEFGAQCGGYGGADGSITAGGTIWTLHSRNTAQTWMVGRYLVLNGTANHAIYSSVWMPTVTSIIDSTHLQLSGAGAPFTIAAKGGGSPESAELWVDDQPGIQAALKWATGGNVNTVTLPAGKCFVSKPILWQGQSMRGMGRDVSFIYGAPGQDVFLSPDPFFTDPATGLPYNYPILQNQHIADFTVYVDGSVRQQLQLDGQGRSVGREQRAHGLITRAALAGQV